MNEPSVFSGDELTMPKVARHYLSNGKLVLHRDVHNIFGALMSKATYEGLILRDQEKLRPFVLTRSAYLGT